MLLIGGIWFLYLLGDNLSVMVTAPLLSMFIVPAVYLLMRRRRA